MVKLLTFIKTLSSSIKLIELTNNSNMQSNLSDDVNVHLSNFQSINSVTESLIFIDKKYFLK